MRRGSGTRLRVWVLFLVLLGLASGPGCRKGRLRQGASYESSSSDYGDPGFGDGGGADDYGGDYGDGGFEGGDFQDDVGDYYDDGF